MAFFDQFTTPPPANPIPAAVSGSELPVGADSTPLTTEEGVRYGRSDTGGLIIEVSGGNSTEQDEPAARATTEEVNFSKPLPNILHQYPSYTYGISLHLMTPESYNETVRSQKYIPKNVLISSAGRRDPSTFPRNQFFNEDFYFEDLNVETIIGLNAASRATNAINIKFKIIEPYGLTLINRILDACSNTDPKIETYTAAPYLLQIDFYSINDVGELIGILPNQSKYIPIQLLKLDIKASAQGSEYDIEAVPFNHNAYTINTLVTPAIFEIVGPDVASIFQSSEKETFIQESQAQLDEEREQDIKKAQTGSFQTPDGQLTYAPSFQFAKRELILSSNAKYRVKSFGSAMNTWHETLKNENQILHEDRYYFKFDSKIGSATFNFEGQTSSRRSSMGEAGGTLDARRGDAGISVADLDSTKKLFTINAGTSLEAMLNYVIRNSSYVQSQLVIPEDYDSLDKFLEAKKNNEKEPLRWFKIVPTITLREYDPIRKRYARDITYNVITHEVWNTKISVAPQGQITTPVKRYDYIYTGKNSDVLDFSIEFNSLYYTAITGYKNKMQSINNVSEPVSDENPEGYPKKENHKFDEVQPHAEIPQAQSSNAPADEVSRKSQAAVDVQQSVYTESGADMLYVNLKIIGDPMFIKQDDIFYSPKFVADGALRVESLGSDPRLTANGSLITDNKEVYIQVNFRTPIDIDESTSLMKFNDNYVESLFSGMYRVLKVNNSFRGGQFLQDVEAVRLPRQLEFDYAKLTSSAENRSSTPQAISSQDTNSAAGKVGSQSTAGEGADTAPGNNPVDPNEPAAQDTEAAKIVSAIQNAPEQPITRATEPAEVPETSAQIANSVATLTRAAANYDKLAEQAQAAGDTALASSYRQAAIESRARAASLSKKITSVGS
jgi:hypothetical protein